jgi:hypothetical protein
MSEIMNVCEVWKNCVWRYTVIYLIIYEGTNCEDDMNPVRYVVILAVVIYML